MDFNLMSWTSFFILTFVVINGTAGDVSKGCNVSLEVARGTISSPHFPNDYDDNARCWYTISAPPHHVITLTFTSFAVEKGFGSACRYDRLLVYDGSTSLDPLIHTLCGYALPAPITSTNNSLTLLFESDDALTYSGFQAQSVLTSVEQFITTEAYEETTTNDYKSTMIGTSLSATEAHKELTTNDYKSTMIRSLLPGFYSPIEFRLSGGQGVNDGRVEVLVDDRWGSVCGDGWNISHAHTTCRQLGYEYALEATRGLRFGLGGPPVYFIMCTRVVDKPLVCSYYKDSDDQCNHWGFAGVVCFVLSSTSNMDKGPVHTIRKSGILAIAPVFVLLILLSVVAFIIRKKRANVSTRRLNVLQLQNMRLGNTPTGECITKCLSETESRPVTSQDRKYEKCETELSMDHDTRKVSSSNHFVAQSQGVKDVPRYEESRSASSDSNMYEELSDEGSSTGDISAIEHTYSSDATVTQNEHDVSEDICGGIDHTYNKEDVYESIT